MVTFEKDIEQCLKVFIDGGIILYPTDTVWGIGCDATNEAAVERIYQLKKRPDTKAMIVLVADEKDILQWVAAPTACFHPQRVAIFRHSSLVLYRVKMRCKCRCWFRLENLK